MILKNQMEEKQLNFNRPLLSVRRGSSSTTVSPEVNKKKSKDSHHPGLPPVLTYYKSDLKSGPIRNPGAIPFRWEQSPGTPKNNKKKSQIQGSLKEHFPLTPKLPPGRILNHQNKQQKPTDNKELKKDYSPASSSRSHSELALSSLELASWEKAISVLQEHEEESKDDLSSSEDDENVTFEDARDRLSRTDSFFLNCSVSGVIGLDDPNLDPFEGLADPKTRDFMMGRFLPAAKAVASETPQFASRKKPEKEEKEGLPQSFLGRERGFLRLSEEPFRDFRASKLNLGKKGGEEISGPSSISTEKNVYIDSEQMGESWSTNSSSSESRGRNPSVDYSLQDIKSLCGGGDEKTISQPKCSDSVFFASEKSSKNVRHDNNNKTQYGSQSSGPPLGMGPLLLQPKSPSESWLSRALPSISSKNPSSKPFAGHNIFRASPMDPRQDRMLKISIVKQHMLVRPPGELAPILED